MRWEPSVTAKLFELERLFWQSVRGDAEAADVAASFVGGERLAIYRRMYVARQVHALRDAYPKLSERLGKRFERVTDFVRHIVGGTQPPAMAGVSLRPQAERAQGRAAARRVQ